MENMLKIILEEIKGVKEEVKDVKNEVKDVKEEVKATKQQLRDEMQEMKQEILEIVDEKIDKQSKEIAEELSQIVVFLEKRDDQLKEAMNELIIANRDIVKEITKMKVENKKFDYRISKLEIRQDHIEDIVLKSS